jgi:hypothetical protein
MPTSVRTLLARLDREIERARRDAETTQQYLTGLEAARDDLARSVLDGAMRPKRQTTSQPRTAVIKAILEEHSAPLPLDQIMKDLAARGRPDQRRLVSATLSYLERQNVARRTGPGQWEAVAA